MPQSMVSEQVAERAKERARERERERRGAGVKMCEKGIDAAL